MTTPLSVDDSLAVWSQPADELGDKPLVLLLHGRGSHEGDLMQLAPMLLPEAVYAAPRALLPFTGGGGYTWFPPAAPGTPPTDGVTAATLGLLEWLDRIAPVGPVAVVGFSQGGALATHLMRHAPDRFAAFVNLSGFSVGGNAPADDRLAAQRPPMFWGRDVDDPVIPKAATDHTAQWLSAHSDLTTRLYPHIGHSISADEVVDVREFLRAHLLGN